MRLWSIHPEYLDSKGLVALWREGLLAQNVLLGKTVGYTNHPQLDRFRSKNNPIGAIASYLKYVNLEARKRGYQFDATKIVNRFIRTKIVVSDAQLKYEFLHLLKKLKQRDIEKYKILKTKKTIKPHPLFVVTKGDIEPWEKV